VAVGVETRCVGIGICGIGPATAALEPRKKFADAGFINCGVLGTTGAVVIGLRARAGLDRNAAITSVGKEAF